MPSHTVQLHASSPEVAQWPILALLGAGWTPRALDLNLFSSCTARRASYIVPRLTCMRFCCIASCRVDPKGSGSTFLVHGQACLKSTTKPKCSFEGGGLPPAKLLQLNIRELMGGDWRVRLSWCTFSQDLRPGFMGGDWRVMMSWFGFARGLAGAPGLNNPPAFSTHAQGVLFFLSFVLVRFCGPVSGAAA